MAGSVAPRGGLALALGLLLLGPSAGAIGPTPAGSAEFVVLSYNVKSIPGAIDTDERLAEIGRLIGERHAAGTAPDVVLIQEGYSRHAAKIRRRTGYRFQLVGARPEGSWLFRNPSGLEVLTDHPIVGVFARAYEDCAFPECLVEKSVLGVTLLVEGVPAPIQVFNTHFQAGTENDAVRLSQMEDLLEFFSRIPFGTFPAVFAGDFNFKPKHPSYHRFLHDFPHFMDVGMFCLGEQEQCRVTVGTHGKSDHTDVWKTAHDRHFVFSPPASRVRIEPIHFIRNFTQDFQGEDLSDHWGLEVHYRLTWPASDS